MRQVRTTAAPFHGAAVVFFGRFFRRLALNTLTEREKQVLILVAQGWSNPEIAERLVISKKTVRNHITHILAKLGVTTRAELIATAWRNGWLTRS
jgi:DNA-binding NarL/FixJ family response regulator